MKFDKIDFSNEELLRLYSAILLPRMIEEKMLVLLRQGKVSKWFSGIGQEAIAVGATLALQPDEYIMPLHRNLGVFTSRQMPLNSLFAQLQGKESGFSKGRERSFHFGSRAHHIVGMISHLGPQLALANGTALAARLDQQPKVSLAFTGDGGTSEGDFHEALNVAAVWELPVIFLIENNGYGLSTPSSDQFRCKHFVDKGIGYGMEAVQVDGNNLLEVHRTVKNLAESMRQKPRPVLLECMTFRMRGHEEASGVKYVPKELIDTWAQRDPVQRYEEFLMEEGILNAGLRDEFRSLHQSDIDKALKVVFAEPEVQPNWEKEISAVYAPFHGTSTEENSAVAPVREMRFVDAIQEGLNEAMKRHSGLVLMGQDIAGYGGVFKVTEGLMDRYGADRVRNTPLCESAIVGTALGLSIAGKKAMVEMQFADFVTAGFNQIVNNLAKIHYRWGQNADVVVRMPTGAGVGAGPFHSQSNEAWFFHTPGLKIVYPSTPAEAKGLLLTAFEDPNPYLFFEHKALYRSISGPVPEGYYTLPVGQARVVRTGNDATIVTYGMGVHWALEAIEEQGCDVELIDLRTLLPWDQDTVLESARKTGRVLVLHEDCLTGGIGGEIAAVIADQAFRFLDAPVMRHGAMDTPVPFALTLEQQFLGVDRFKLKLKALLEY
ncbi:MAG: dehydrogenase E1 component subunit alpha/beta [Bacteroidetes bacterium]|nr:dehydrogenase E1 component subunit alpha/beta [Bacteroidota bacterium]